MLAEHDVVPCGTEALALGEPGKQALQQLRCQTAPGPKSL